MEHASNTVSPARVVVRWVAVVAMAAFIFYMSSRSADQLGSGWAGHLKEQMNAWLNVWLGVAGDPMSAVAHFCEYLLLGALLANALRSHMSPSRALWVAILCASAYGATDEFHQLFVDGRYCDIADWATDSAGAALGSALSWLVQET